MIRPPTRFTSNDNLFPYTTPFRSLALTTGPANGRALDVERDFCHALSGAALGDDALSGLRFSCSGAPAGYQQGSLWLRAPLDDTAPRRDLALMVHNSRFDRLAVAFSDRKSTRLNSSH